MPVIRSFTLSSTSFQRKKPATCRGDTKTHRREIDKRMQMHGLSTSRYRTKKLRLRPCFPCEKQVGNVDYTRERRVVPVNYRIAGDANDVANLMKRSISTNDDRILTSRGSGREFSARTSLHGVSFLNSLTAKGVGKLVSLVSRV